MFYVTIELTQLNPSHTVAFFMHSFKLRNFNDGSFTVEIEASPFLTHSNRVPRAAANFTNYLSAHHSAARKHKDVISYSTVPNPVTEQTESVLIASYEVDVRTMGDNREYGRFG
jgi:hypothetical protein